MRPETLTSPPRFPQWSPWSRSTSLASVHEGDNGGIVVSDVMQRPCL